MKDQNIMADRRGYHDPFTPTPPKPNQDQQSNRFYPLNQLTALYAIV